MSKNTRTAQIKLFFLIAAFALAAGFLAKVYWSAQSPSSVKVTVYKVEFMADRSDAKPITVFSDPAGKDIDLVSETGDFMGRPRLEAGVYKRIRLTVRNGFSMSIADAESNPCKGAGQFSDRVFPLFEEKDLGSLVPVYFAADVDGGGTWKDSQITNLLIRPVTVSQDGAGEVKLRFIVADTLFCLEGKAERRAPWSVWPETAL